MRIEVVDGGKTIHIIPETKQDHEVLDQAWRPEVAIYFDEDDRPYLELTLKT